jgi:hypothetical protein
MFLRPSGYGSEPGWPLWNVADGLAELLPGKIELVGFLEIHPEIGAGPK